MHDGALDSLWHTRWLTQFSHLAPVGQPEWIEQGFSDLVDRYAEPHRRYHNLAHIQACLTTFDEVLQSHIELAEAERFQLETTFWFHDVVYDPKANDNEAQSAERAADFLLPLDLDPSQVEEIKRLIRLTKHPATPVAEGEKLLLDIDLQILGASPPDYLDYQNQIRAEYGHVPDQAYQRGRAQVLLAFLDQPQIFHSQIFYESREAQARENILREIDQLSSS